MLKRNRSITTRLLFFGFIGLALLLFATAPVASQDTTTPPAFRYYLYFNDELVAGTDVPATQFKLDITEDGKLEPLHIVIFAGTGPDKVYIHDFWGTVELVQGAGSVYRYPQQDNYPVGQTFEANAPDTKIFDQTIDVLKEAAQAGYDLPEPIYTGFIQLTVYIRYAVGGPPPGISSSAQSLQLSTMQAVGEEGLQTAQDSVQVNVQDWYVVDPTTGEKTDTTAGQRLADQLRTPAGQATVGVTAVAGVGVVAAGLQAGGVFPSFMSGVPSGAALGPGSLFGTTGTLQNFVTGKLSSEARNRILSKIAFAIKNRVRRMGACPSCGAKWSAPEVCPGCGLLTAELIHEYRNALKSTATRAAGLLTGDKKATVAELATKLGTSQGQTADVMSVLTEAGLLKFGVAAAGTGASTAAGLTAGIALPQWLNLTGTYAMNLYFMIGLAAVGVVVPLLWTKLQKRKIRQKYEVTEVEKVPEELSEDIGEMEEAFTKASGEKVETTPEEAPEETSEETSEEE